MHPTCANFRSASKLVLEHFIRAAKSSDRWVCEVGAGRSLVAEILLQLGRGLDKLLITDSSLDMLSYSAPFAEQGALLIRSTAELLPFYPSNIACFVASLGDPYNTLEVWKHLYHLLPIGGRVCFTTPAWEWASAFRPLDETPSLDSAEFTLADGTTARLPSIILHPLEQEQLIKLSGFRLLSIEHVTSAEINDCVLSPKLLVGGYDGGRIVTGYIAEKC